MQVGSAVFILRLRQLEICARCISSFGKYAEYAEYSHLCRQLQSRAMSTVKNYMLATLSAAPGNENDMIRWNAPSKNRVKSAGLSLECNTENVYSDHAYVFFRRRLALIRPVIAELEMLSRSDADLCSRVTYSQTLVDCQVIYCKHRISMVSFVFEEQLQVTWFLT